MDTDATDPADEVIDLAAQQPSSHPVLKQRVLNSAKIQPFVYKSYGSAARLLKPFIDRLSIQNLAGEFRVVYSSKRLDWAIDVAERISLVAAQRLLAFSFTEFAICHAVTHLCSPRVAPSYPLLVKSLWPQISLPVSRMSVKTIFNWRLVQRFALADPIKKTNGASVLTHAYMCLNNLIEAEIVESGNVVCDFLTTRGIAGQLIDTSVDIMTTAHFGGRDKKFLGEGVKTNIMKALVGSVGSFLVLLLGGKAAAPRKQMEGAARIMLHPYFVKVLDVVLVRIEIAFEKGGFQTETARAFHFPEERHKYDAQVLDWAAYLLRVLMQQPTFTDIYSCLTATMKSRVAKAVRQCAKTILRTSSGAGAASAADVDRVERLNKSGVQGLVKLMGGKVDENDASESSAPRTAVVSTGDVEALLSVSADTFRRPMPMFSDPIEAGVPLAPIAAASARAGFVSQCAGSSGISADDDAANRAARAAAAATARAVNQAWASHEPFSRKRKAKPDDAFGSFTTKSGLSCRSAAHVALARGIRRHKREAMGMQ